MQHPYRNIGAAFARADGSTWDRSAVHVPTDAELKRRGYKLRIEMPVVVVAAPLVVAAPRDLTVAEWPLRMTPDIYLKLYPDGPHAEHARALATTPPVVVVVEGEAADVRSDE